MSESCVPMDCSTPGSLSITNSPSLLKLMYIESLMSSSHLIFCHPLLLLPSMFPSIRMFSKHQYFASGSQSIGVSASASFLPMNIQDGFPLGWTAWISLHTVGLESSPTPQLKSINSSALSFLYGPTLTSIRDYWKKHSLDWMDLCWHSDVSAF